MPFDDPAVIAGNGTVGLEILDDVPDVDVVVVGVGGGGLISGQAGQGCKPENRVLKHGNVRIIAQASGWSHADIDEDGNADGFVVNSDLTPNLATMPAWGSLS